MSNLRQMRILTNDNNAQAQVEQNTEIHINTTPTTEVVYPTTFPSVYPTTNNDEKDKKIKVLELLLDAYESNPLILDNYIIVKTNKLIEIITLLTDADKVEIHVSPDSCTCCNNKIAYIDKIFIIKNEKTLDFKYNFNESYSLLKKHNISLKLTF